MRVDARKPLPISQFSSAHPWPAHWQFTGEVNMLSGRPALLRARARESGEVIELDHEQLLALVQTDSELSELIMRAFILRRVELIAHGLGDVVLVAKNRILEGV